MARLKNVGRRKAREEKMTKRELKRQISEIVNVRVHLYDPDQISEIADRILSLDGFDLKKRDNLFTVDTGIFFRNPPRLRQWQKDEILHRG